MFVLCWFSFVVMLFVGFYFFMGGSFWLMVLVIVLFNLCCGFVVLIFDVMVNYYVKLKMFDYGCICLWGLIVFIVGLIVVGFLVVKWGSLMILYMVLVGVVVFWLLSLC